MIENKLYAGKIVSPLNVGQSKVERLERFLDGPGQWGMVIENAGGS